MKLQRLRHQIIRAAHRQQRNIDPFGGQEINFFNPSMDNIHTDDIQLSPLNIPVDFSQIMDTLDIDQDTLLPLKLNDTDL